ncbi:MAG: tetratricopeptide repeat protein, partial [Anaerolineales bacterium]|nr:tetratricopeptide repeat protein [Anaerolineales bacterium]
MYSAAIADFTRGIELDPGNGGLHNLRAESHSATETRVHASGFVQEGGFELADDDFARAIELEPSSYQHFLGRANLRTAQENFADAITDLSSAIQLSQANPELYFLRAEALVSLGNPTQAVADYVRAIQLNPSNPDYYLSRALALITAGSFELALADADLTVEAFPNDARFHSARGEANLGLGNYQEALEDYEQALSLYTLPEPTVLLQQPGSPVGGWTPLPEYYAGRATSLAALGDVAAALRDFDQAIEMAPEAAHLYSQRANGLMMVVCGQPEATEEAEVISEEVETEEEQPEAAEEIEAEEEEQVDLPAGCSPDPLSMEKLDAAIADYGTAIDLSPDAQYYMERAYAYEALQARLAVHDIDAAIESAEARDATRFDQALDILGRILSSDAENLNAVLAQAGVHALLRQTELAVDDYSRALELDAENA